MAFPGYDTTSVQYPRLKSLTLAVWGAHFNAAGKFVNVGLRKVTKVDRKVVSISDVAKRDIADKIAVELDGDMLQTGFPNVLNAYILSKQFAQAQLQNVHGQWLNFVDNGGTFTTPTGSALLGFGFTFTISEKDRNIAFKAGTHMSNTEWDWLVANSASGATGGTGGPTVSLTPNAYDRTKYVRTGIKSVTVGGITVGCQNGAKLVIKSMNSEKDDRERVLNCWLDIAGEVTMLQTKSTDIAAISAALEQVDATIVYNTWNDETITLSSGVASGVGEILLSDDKNTAKLVAKGQTVYNPDEPAPPPPYVDIGVTTATDLKLSLAGYN